MISTATGEQFAAEWIDAWNRHDLDRILSHYEDAIEFYSPFIVLLGFNDTGHIRGKEALSAYFRKGLDAYPDLTFALHQVLTGAGSVVIYYTSVNGRKAAEVFELSVAGKAQRVMCHYTN